MSTAARVLHVGDAALTAAQLVVEARDQGLPWEHLALAGSGRAFTGSMGHLRRAVVGAAWIATLGVRARRHDIVHVHSATTLPHVRPVSNRFVLHCHGTDVRTTQYDPARSASIRAGLRDAEAVVYSTPDLAEHVLPHRPDASLLPVPVTVGDVPLWRPDGEPARIVFASRWEEVKGLTDQLATARLLVRALAGRAEVLGLDWGPAAAEARSAGVRLIPRLDHAAYLRLLAGSSAVVGQSSGILSASELEALASGAPLAIPTRLPLYAGSPPPVLGDDPESVADAVAEVVGDPALHTPNDGRAWVAQWHGTARGVETLRSLYDTVLAART